VTRFTGVMCAGKKQKKNMTSMYTNTHLTAKKKEENDGKDGTHSMMIM